MRRTVVISGVVAAVVAITAGAVVGLRAASPDHRITFLVDGSAGDLAPVGAAVSAAAGNTGDRDSLALRRFGGECGDAANTSSLVDAGTSQQDAITTAVGTLAPAGKPTLLSGVLAAIDDFDRRYPFRGRLSNRIIVVARHGADACTADQAAVSAQIQQRLRERDLDLDFRFVGFQVPEAERDSFTALAGGSAPIFPQTAADLEAVLKQFTIPDPPDAAQVVLPSPPDPTAGWTAYANAEQGYSLRYPPGWISSPCALSGQFNHWLAEDPDLIPACVATDFFFYRVWVRINDIANAGPITPLSPDAFTDIGNAPVTIASGATGQRQSGVLTSDEFGGQAPGSRLVSYAFDAGARRYTVSLTIAPGETNADALIADFDLLVKNTLRIEG